MSTIKNKIVKSFGLFFLFFYQNTLAGGSQVENIRIDGIEISKIVKFMLIDSPSWQQMVARIGKTDSSPEEQSTKIKSKYSNVSYFELLFSNGEISIEFNITDIKLTDLEKVFGKSTSLVPIRDDSSRGEASFNVKNSKNNCRIIAIVPVQKDLKNVLIKHLTIECEYDVF